MTPIVAILGTRYENFQIEEAALASLDVELRSDPGASADEIVRVAGDATVILAGAAPRFDAATLGRLSCRGIVRYGVGVDSIDLEAARASGISVARVADYGTEAVALHTLALVLAAIRDLHQADARIRRGEWGFAPLRPLQLPEAMTAGVVGYGRIGRRVAQMLAALGFRVLAYDTVALPPAEGPVAPVELDELLAASDVVTLHASGLESGEPLIDRMALERLPHGAVLVNTSRGSLIDTAALADGLRKKRPRVAALDVFPGEPPDLSGFHGVLDRLILTPHMAWYTQQSEQVLRTKAAEAARRLLSGERPEDLVVDSSAGAIA